MPYIKVHPIIIFFLTNRLGTKYIKEELQERKESKKILLKAMMKVKVL